MKCKTVHKKIIFFLERELPAGEMEQVRLHLSECNDCAAFAEEIKKTFAFLESEKSPAVNPFFYTRLKAKMENRADAENAKYNNPVWLKVLQPAFFSILLIVGIYSGIKIGQPVVKKSEPVIYAEQQIIPFLDEMENESIETFLMK
jgi:hypothetical protein